MWHAQVTSLTLRHYAPGAGYSSHDPFDAVAQVELLGDGVAFLHAALSVDGKPLSIRAWRELGRLLHTQFGIRHLQAERPRGRVTFDLARITAATPHP